MSDELRERTIVVDNTTDGSVGDVLEEEGFTGTVTRMYRNLGVAGAWNAACRTGFEGWGCAFVTLCSSSIRFGLDGGNGLARTADVAVSQSQWQYGFESMNGWRLFTLGADTWKKVGSFDERFFPAYFEDNDYIWRMRCAGILEPRGKYFKGHPRYCDFSARKIPWIGALEYEVAEEASAIKRVHIEVDFVDLEAYYVHKWGGKPGEERFTRPATGAG